jgi:hypothetical protein
MSWFAANLGGAQRADKREEFMLAANQLMQTFPDGTSKLCSLLKETKQ